MRAFLHLTALAAVTIGTIDCSRHDAPAGATPSGAVHALTVSDAGDGTGQACSATGERRKSQACQPTVMVVRHAEDGSSATNPHYLTAAGQNHARLYESLFHDYVYGKAHGLGAGGTEVCVCPIGKIIAIDPNPNAVNRSPSPNPYETIKPLATALQLPIQVKDAAGNPYTSAYEWTTVARQALLEGGANATTSTAIAWDKQGLNRNSADIEKAATYGLDLRQPPLLQKLPKVFSLEPGGTTFIPERHHLFVFSAQDPSDGKFAGFKLYEQSYSHDDVAWYTTPFLNDLPKRVRVETIHTTAVPAVTYVKTYADTFATLASWNVMDNYNDPAGSPVKYMKANVVPIAGGGLRIKVTAGAPSSTGKWRSQSGRLSSFFAQKYGLFMFQAKVPRGQHLWPALWTVGKWTEGELNKWPKTGEIDVMEVVDAYATRPDFTSRLMLRTGAFPSGVYFTSLPPDSSLEIKTVLTEAQWKETHTFALDWYEVRQGADLVDVRYDFYMDAKVTSAGALGSVTDDAKRPVKLHSYSLKKLVEDNNKNPSVPPVPDWKTLNTEWSAQSFVLNVAVGGAWDTAPQAVTSGTWKPAIDGTADMIVDWVKCYQRVEKVAP